MSTLVIKCAVNRGEVNEINKEVFLNYALWLKKDKKVSSRTGYIYCKVIEEIIKIGQIKDWNVPKKNIFVDFTSLDLWDTKSL